MVFMTALTSRVLAEGLPCGPSFLFSFFHSFLFSTNFFFFSPLMCPFLLKSFRNENSSALLPMTLLAGTLALFPICVFFFLLSTFLKAIDVFLRWCGFFVVQRGGGVVVFVQARLG